MKKHLKVMIISKTSMIADLIKEILSKDFYPTTTLVKSGEEGKRLLIEGEFDIVVINTPLLDQDGIECAIDMSRNSDMGIVVLVKQEYLTHIANKLEDFGVLAVGKPITKNELLSSLKLMTFFRFKQTALKGEIDKLKERMKELQVVNTAKCLLIEKENMTESQSHRVIEKTAMDRCQKKIIIANEIINKYR